MKKITLLKIAYVLLILLSLESYCYAFTSTATVGLGIVYTHEDSCDNFHQIGIKSEFEVGEDISLLVELRGIKGTFKIGSVLKKGNVEIDRIFKDWDDVDCDDNNIVKRQYYYRSLDVGNYSIYIYVDNGSGYKFQEGINFKVISLKNSVGYDKRVIIPYLTKDKTWTSILSAVNVNSDVSEFRLNLYKCGEIVDSSTWYLDFFDNINLYMDIMMAEADYGEILYNGNLSFRLYYRHENGGEVCYHLTDQISERVTTLFSQFDNVVWKGIAITNTSDYESKVSISAINYGLHGILGTVHMIIPAHGVLVAPHYEWFPDASVKEVSIMDVMEEGRRNCLTAIAISGNEDSSQITIMPGVDPEK